MRAIALGGVFKTYLKDLREEPDDLVNTGLDDEVLEEEFRIFDLGNGPTGHYLVT